MDGMAIHRDRNQNPISKALNLTWNPKLATFFRHIIFQTPFRGFQMKFGAEFNGCTSPDQGWRKSSRTWPPRSRCVCVCASKTILGLIPNIRSDFSCGFVLEIIINIHQTSKTNFIYSFAGSIPRPSNSESRPSEAPALLSVEGLKPLHSRISGSWLRGAIQIATPEMNIH